MFLPNGDSPCHYFVINYLYFKFNMALIRNHARPMWEKGGKSYGKIDAHDDD